MSGNFSKLDLGLDFLLRELLMKFLQFASVPALTLLVLLPFPSPALPTPSEHRPHWAEKSSFIIGDELYAVGVASGVATIEEGRRKAFDEGVVEIKNFAQTEDLSDLVIETQMIFETPNADRTITVYRLLKVSLEKLLATKKEAFDDDWTSPSPRMKKALERLRILRQP